MPVRSCRHGANPGASFSSGTLVEDTLVPPERVMPIYTMPRPSRTADNDGQVYVAGTVREMATRR